MESSLLPFIFEASKLINDLTICQKTTWPIHFNQNDYTGHWSSFSLRSITGTETDILATPNAQFNDTPILKQCEYFQKIIDLFECPKEAVRLMSLSPKSYIKEHSDNSSGYEDGFFRIHIPIQTNEKVVFKVNGKVIPMLVGQCWYANFNLPHFVSNDGDRDRIHLVIDCIRNEWSDQLFLELGYDFEKEKNNNKKDPKTILLMIEELSLMQNETAEKLIIQLKSELA